MNKKYLWLIAFALPLVALMIWTAGLYVQRHSGQDVRVRVTGYDPRDLLSGHYIQYQIDWKNTDCVQFENQVCPDEKYFCKKARWGTQCRFYIPEKEAPRLDNLFRNRNKTEDVFEVVYSYRPGHKAMAKQLLINGADWRLYPRTKEDLHK